MNTIIVTKKEVLAKQSMHSIRPRAVRLDCSKDKSLTEQIHKDECNINFIMNKYQKTGVVNHVKSFKGVYMDLSSSSELHEALNNVRDAQELFETVPAQIRADFDNDMGKFIDFMQNPAERENIEAYGFDASHLPEIPPETPVTPPVGDAHLQQEFQTFMEQRSQNASQAVSEQTSNRDS